MAHLRAEQKVGQKAAQRAVWKAYQRAVKWVDQ